MPYCPKCWTEYVAGTTECEDCGTELKQGSLPERKNLRDESQSGSERSPFAIAVESLLGAGPLEDTSPEKLARVRTFSGPTALVDATLARNLLESQGIPCALPGEVVAETLPGVDLVQLLVREEDSIRAAEILASYLDNPAPPLDDESLPA